MGNYGSGYDFKDAGDKQRGVWTENEKRVETARRRAQQQAAAASALAEMEQKIAAIRADATLTAQEKLQALRRLTASGYGDEEFRVLRAAQKDG